VNETLNSIYQILQKLIGLHRQMLESVRLEHQGLVEADLKAIEEATRTKEALIAAIRQQESLRIKHTAELAVEWKRSLRELTLTEIILTVQAKDIKAAEQFRSALNALTVLISRVKEQNSANHMLVEKSLLHVGNMKNNVLGQTVKRTETYTHRGQRAVKPGEARLLSREA
jgi:hypothetical protein